MFVLGLKSDNCGLSNYCIFACFFKYTLMRIVFIFISILLFHISGYPQNTKNQLDEQGKRHGLWEKNYDNSDQVRFSGEFFNGIEIGVFRFFSRSGILVAEKIYIDKTEVCHTKLYNSNNLLAAEGDFDRKEKEGLWKYYSSDKYLLMTENYLDGVLQGKKTTFYKDGKIAEESFYENDLLQGKLIRYTNDENKIAELNYQFGVLQGEVIYYNVDGTEVMRGNYKDGKRFGIWEYLENGKVVKTENYNLKKVKE